MEVVKLADTFFVCPSCGRSGDYWNRINFCKEYCSVDVSGDEYDPEYEFVEHDCEVCPYCDYDITYEDAIVEVEITENVMDIKTFSMYDDIDLLIQGVCNYLDIDVSDFDEIYVNDDLYYGVEDEDSDDDNYKTSGLKVRKVTVWGW